MSAVVGNAGKTVIHGNHGFIKIGTTVVGRLRNVTMTLTGSADEFYEIGSSYIQQIEITNRKVDVSIERGIVDYLLLTLAGGGYSELAAGAVNFASNLVNNQHLVGTDGLNEYTANSASVGNSVSNESTPILLTDFEFDIVIVANKIAGTTTNTEFTVTANDVKILDSVVTAPTNEYWIGSMTGLGKTITVAAKEVTA